MWPTRGGMFPVEGVAHVATEVASYCWRNGVTGISSSKTEEKAKESRGRRYRI